MKKYLGTLLCAMVALAFLLSPVAMAADSGPIKIEYVTFIAKNHVTVKLFEENWREVEKRSNGRLQFVNKGGPEAIKIFAQAMAVYKGATDMVLTTPSFMGKLAKGTTMLTLCAIPVSKHRESGLYDYVNEVYNKTANMQFIQMFPREMGTAFTMLTKEKIDTLSGFKGKTLRGGDYIDAIAETLGMNVVAMKYFEEYSALERGVIDVGRMTVESMAELKLYEVAKYLIHPLHGSAPMSWFMNLKKWNSIPPDLQKLILDTLYELADATEAKYKTVTQKAYDELKANGVQIVELQGKDREKYSKDVHKAMYDYYLKDNPEVAKKIYELSH